MHISDLVINNRMICSKCKGFMVREDWFDLPGGFFEFICLNCGERVWVSRDMMEKPIYTN